MLYNLHELQRAFLKPLTAFTDSGSCLFSHPYSPWAYTPVSRHLAAAYELAHRLGKEYEKPAWGLPHTEVDGEQVAIEETCVLEKPFCKLVHFERQLPSTRPADPKVLVVAPLSGHHATLLRDTVRVLLPAHDVYVTDWIDARMVPLSLGSFSLDDYVAYVQAFIRALGPDTHVIAVCQPVVPVLAAIALMSAHQEETVPLSMTMMGGPIDARRSPTQVNDLASNKPYSWFEQMLIDHVPLGYPGAGRRVYPGFLQHAGFVAMNPGRHVQSHYDFYLNLVKGDDQDADSHRRFYDEYNAVLDMPAEYYLQTIRVVFQEYLLARGLWEIDGEKVDPGAITRTALLTIEGELDDISGPGQTHAAQQLCTGIDPARRQEYTAAGCGHYGIFSGRRWRKLIYPRIAEFIRQA